jgi:hypothetical protein
LYTPSIWGWDGNDSRFFAREPLLKYVCAKYFEGDANSIKEYCIAVDVLGRSSDFDPKKDSVIRVRFHRLREKLNDVTALLFLHLRQSGGNSVQNSLDVDVNLPIPLCDNRAAE